MLQNTSALSPKILIVCASAHVLLNALENHLATPIYKTAWISRSRCIVRFREIGTIKRRLHCGQWPAIVFAGKRIPSYVNCAQFRAQFHAATVTPVESRTSRVAHFVLDQTAPAIAAATLPHFCDFIFHGTLPSPLSS